MAKNNMDILLGNILGSAAISPDNKTVEQTPETKPIPKQEKRSVKAERKEQLDNSWRHFSFICSRELVDKVQAIAYKEGFTIRAFMEYVMKQGIEAYEAKHGKARKVKKYDEMTRTITLSDGKVLLIDNILSIRRHGTPEL